MTGLLIGAVFGAVFVFVNTHDPLNGTAVLLLRVAAGLAAAAVLVMWFTTVRGERESGGASKGAMYGRGYLAVVAAEAILLFGGLRVLGALEAPEQANVAWVALVVGVHFVVLAPIWKSWDIAVPGTVLTLLGVAGLALAPTSVAAWVPFLSGVLSGIVLLAAALAVGWRTVAARTN
ncbi:hypothetical protein [Nonomuraea gerenzanensis]|nr:hypothetical protein [Nonomuraea gerenzanensis]UBU09437.1 hypothetical protein LCN96_34375 [Nonomuraea gerenzanensis]